MQGSFSPAMPKKKRAGVATHRAKQKEEEQAATVEEESDDAEELGQYLHVAPGLQTEPKM